MSFEFNWEAIRAEESLARVKHSLNEQINSWHDGSFLDGLCIEELVLGAHPPEVLIEEIGDPKPPFTCSTKPAEADATTMSPNSLQTTLLINYESTLRVVLRAELVVNYPAPRFISLPVRLLLRRVRLRALRLIVVHLAEGRTMISLRRDDPEACLEYDLDTEVGDSARHGSGAQV